MIDSKLIIISIQYYVSLFLIFILVNSANVTEDGVFFL